jgi:nitrogen fixation NifU-like protein
VVAVHRLECEMAYSEKVLDHYENPRNVGSFAKDDNNIGTGMVGAPACGDVMKLQIKVEDGIITDAKFKTYGCGSAIASSSLVTEWIKGKTLEQAGSIKNTHIAEELALPPVKIHCSILAEDAIKAAIADYEVKCECNICYDDKELKNFVKLGCNHEFCKDCVIETMKTSNNKLCCAFCRTEITGIESRTTEIKSEIDNYIE